MLNDAAQQAVKHSFSSFRWFQRVYVRSMEYFKLLILFSILVAVTSSPVSKARCSSAWAASFGYRCRVCI